MEGEVVKFIGYGEDQFIKGDIIGYGDRFLAVVTKQLYLFFLGINNYILIIVIYSGLLNVINVNVQNQLQ